MSIKKEKKRPKEHFVDRIRETDVNGEQGERGRNFLAFHRHVPIISIEIFIYFTLNNWSKVIPNFNKFIINFLLMSDVGFNTHFRRYINQSYTGNITIGIFD